jgi:glycosyltransferase involved in cell wall biosynthesis
MKRMKNVGSNCHQKPPKCVFVFWSASQFGGMERRYARLASYLMSNSPECNVSVCTQRRCERSVRSYFTDEHQDKIVAYGVKPTIHRRHLIDTTLDLFQLFFYLVNLRDSHIHICQNPGVITFLAALLVPSSARLSMVMVDCTYGRTSTLLSRFLARVHINRYSGVDCLSAKTKALLEHFFDRINLNNLHTAPCSFSDYSQVKRSVARDIDLLMLARFVPGKGYDLLSQIQDDLLAYNVYCCGTGPLPIDIKNARLGYAKDPYEILSRTKVFLSLQAVDNYPSQSVLEAMASGCAIIATDVGETRKFLDEQCSILIECNADALRYAIKKLMTDERLRADLSNRARERVRLEHTIERYALYFKHKILGINHSHNHRS